MYRLNEIVANETIETDNIHITRPFEHTRTALGLHYEYTIEVTQVPFRLSFKALRHYQREPETTSVSEIVRTPPEQVRYLSQIYVENEEGDAVFFINDSHIIDDPGTYRIRITYGGRLEGEDSEGREMERGAMFGELAGEPYLIVLPGCNVYNAEIGSNTGSLMDVPAGEYDARFHYRNDEVFDWNEVEPGPDEPILQVDMAGLRYDVTYDEIGIGGTNWQTWRISTSGLQGRFTVDTPYRFHRGDSATFVICPPGTFDPAEPTLSPTPDPQCQVYELDSQLSLIPISEGARLRSISGVAIVIFNGNIEIPVSGMTWPHPASFYNAYAEFEVAELEVCGDGFTPSPSVTPITPLPSTTATALPATPTPTTTQTPTPTATPTGTLLPTPTALPATPCEGEVWNVPVVPDVVRIRLDTGLKIAVLDATVYINVGESAQTLRPGSYNWSFASESYDVYSLTTPARLILCNLEPLPNPSAIASPPPTWTTDPDEDACLAPPTLVPTDNTGNLPELGLLVPTMQELPTHVTITATVTITDIDALSTTLELATVIIAPVQTMTAWCQQEFGPDGWRKGQVDAGPIVALVGGALGWLALFGLLGPLEWLVPPVFITVLIRVGRAVLSIIKYIKQIIPFQ